MKDEIKNKDSRRNFLVKTSAVSLISALPATSAWGACTVSGALSGGSKVNGDCTTVPLSNGRSPGSWRDFSNGKKMGSAFPYINTFAKKSAQKKCERNHLASFILAAQDVTIILGKDKQGDVYSLDVKAALANSGGIGWNLAAVYLNAEFGFYANYLPATLNTGDTISNGEDLVKHLFALDALNGTPSNEDTYYGFSDGSTDYEPPIASSC
jgi:hypothetical protein